MKRPVTSPLDYLQVMIMCTRYTRYIGKSNRSFIIFFICILPFSFSHSSGQPLPLDPDKITEGSISISGNTDCTSFRLEAEISERNISHLPEHNTFRFSIPVTAFKARFRMIEKDFNDMVRGSIYPEIIVLFPFPEIFITDSLPVEVNLAGKKLLKKVFLKNTNEYSSNFRLVEGETTINLKELGLVPPRSFAGLCEIHDTILITFVFKVRD